MRLSYQLTSPDLAEPSPFCPHAISSAIINQKTLCNTAERVEQDLKAYFEAKMNELNVQSTMEDFKLLGGMTVTIFTEVEIAATSEPGSADHGVSKPAVGRW